MWKKNILYIKYTIDMYFVYKFEKKASTPRHEILNTTREDGLQGG